MKPRHGERHNGRSGLESRLYAQGAWVNVQHTDRPAATRHDWKRKPLPEKRTTIPLGRAYSVGELSLIRQGLVPQHLADQWFIFHEEGALFFHRSWTGHCIYVVHFHEAGEEIRATHVDVNRDPGQYSETDDQRDREAVLELIHLLLLQRPVPQGA